MNDRAEILDAHGRPARRARDQACPRCGASPSARIRSAGFGTDWHDVCSQCGHGFDEQTVPAKRETR